MRDILIDFARLGFVLSSVAFGPALLWIMLVVAA